MGRFLYNTIQRAGLEIVIGATLALCDHQIFALEISESCSVVPGLFYVEVSRAGGLCDKDFESSPVCGALVLVFEVHPSHARFGRCLPYLPSYDPVYNSFSSVHFRLGLHDLRR